MAKALATAGEERRISQQTPAPWKDKPLEFWQFLKDVRSEMHKVVVPSRKEVETTTVIVIITVFVFAAYFYIIDNAIGYAVKSLLHWLST